MDRRDSESLPSRRSSANPNVFDDEFAIDEAGVLAVADGFRPVTDAPARAPDTAEPLPSRRSFSASLLSEGSMRKLAARNSVSKPSARCMSSDSRSTAHARGPSTYASSSQRRASISSTGSFATMAQSESPLGAGPSHPYGMYPQTTAVRTSVARNSTSGQRPTYPYGMYPQAAMGENEAMGIPVGFLGLRHDYNRRIGPDGEEQDIIGADGHAEQLPPYTRYPEDSAARAVGATRAPLSPIASLQPNRPDDPSASSLRHSLQGARQDAQSPEPESPEEPIVSEKAEDARGFKAWCRKRILGRIPVGLVLVLLVLVLVLAVILGAAVGAIVANHSSHHNKPDHDNPQSVQVTSTLIDATPVSTPSDLRPLPQGSFALPFGIAQESNANCLTTANQVSAWSCSVPPIPIQMTVCPQNSSMPQALASLGPIQGSQGAYQYGVQPPSLPMQPLSLVMDQDQPTSFGPAYHFQTSYNKVVILSTNDFAAGMGLRRRGGFGPPGSGGPGSRFQVQPGDAFWYCSWNETMIEGYIYVQDNSSLPTMMPSPSSSGTTTFSPPPTPPPSSSDWKGAPWSAAATTKLRRESVSSSVPPFPRVAKVEERRLPGSPQAVCEKMQMRYDGGLVPSLDGQGVPITIDLAETDPSLSQFFSASSPSPSDSRRHRSKGKERRDPSEACHCQWLYQ